MNMTNSGLDRKCRICQKERVTCEVPGSVRQVTRRKPAPVRRGRGDDDDDDQGGGDDKGGDDEEEATG